MMEGFIDGVARPTSCRRAPHPRTSGRTFSRFPVTFTQRAQGSEQTYQPPRCGPKSNAVQSPPNPSSIVLAKKKRVMARGKSPYTRLFTLTVRRDVVDAYFDLFTSKPFSYSHATKSDQ